MTTSCAGSGSGGAGGSGPTGSGGSTGGAAGGSSGSGNCGAAPSGGAVNFCNGKAQGLMSGYGWVALGTLDNLSDPTCDTTKTPITKAAACTTTTNWSTADGLCISGTIPGLPASPVQADYDANWGLEIGVNTSEPPVAKGGTTLGGAYTSVALTFTGTPTTGLRAEIHRKGDGDSGVFCANISSSGTPISLASFSTQCWGGCPGGTPAPAGIKDTSVCYPLTAADVPNIDLVGVQVSSTAAPITVSNLCLTNVEFK
jgi:hypothetical protein